MKRKNKNKKNHLPEKSVMFAFISKSGKKGISKSELITSLKLRAKDKKQAFRQLSELCGLGKIVFYNGRYYSSVSASALPAKVVRINRTFGFVRPDGDGQKDIFVAGKFLMGALPGDKVLIKKYVTDKGEEARVIAVTEKNDSPISGSVVKKDGKSYIMPDSAFNLPVILSKRDNLLPEGEKIIASIVKRGDSHSEHKAEMLERFGSSESAQACSAAICAAAGIYEDFPIAVCDEASAAASGGIKQSDLFGRADYRNLNIFTIDGADSKDLDDAVYVEKLGDYYVLGVHIADVSHYVRKGSNLDKEAYMRGTSVYYADKVVPMLPKELSNGICSLNPNEDRLAFSAVITFDSNGIMLDYKFEKSVICSRVKGVYSEINKILSGTADDDINSKYSGLRNTIFLMDELADKLTAVRNRRGAPDIDAVESRIITENGCAAEIKPRERGKAERIIEEFMLSANQAAAMFASKAGIPFVYRVHQPPSADKIDILKQTLSALDISVKQLRSGESPSEICAVLEAVKNSPYRTAVNRMAVRSMSKAEYSDKETGHYGLALQDYAHFTSPIRRYPDLAVHRILSSFLEIMNPDNVKSKFTKFASKAAKRSTETEINAVKTERMCEDCYKAEYMKQHIGEEFSAQISSVTSFGVYAELENTVEGLIPLEELPHGDYFYDGGVVLKDNLSGYKIKVGDKVVVKCVKADVQSGQVDFSLIKFA